MYGTIGQIKRANREHGHTFFEPPEMRFFDSRIGRAVIGGRFFISSERAGDDHPRLYTIRMARDDGSIEDVGEFQGYRSEGAAKAALAKALRSGELYIATHREEGDADPGQSSLAEAANDRDRHLIHQVVLGELTVGYQNTLPLAETLMDEVAGSVR